MLLLLVMGAALHWVGMWDVYMLCVNERKSFLRCVYTVVRMHVHVVNCYALGTFDAVFVSYFTID